MTSVTEQQSILQQRYPEFTHYIQTHAHAETVHHANGIVASDSVLQNKVVEYWIAQLLNTSIHIRLHPDVLTISAEGNQITRQDCKELLPWVYTRPQHSPFRIVHIVGVHRLNAFAANSLLKLIEEPPVYTVIFLSTHTPYGLPATIRSRVQWFWVSNNEIKQYNERHQFWIHWLKQSIATRDALLHEAFLSVSKKEALHQLPEHLTSLQELFCDMILMQTTGNSHLAQSTTSSQIRDIAKCYTVEQLRKSSAVLVELERMCRAQVNKKNIIDYLIVAL